MTRFIQPISIFYRIRVGCMNITPYQRPVHCPFTFQRKGCRKTVLKMHYFCKSVKRKNTQLLLNHFFRIYECVSAKIWKILICHETYTIPLDFWVFYGKTVKFGNKFDRSKELPVLPEDEYPSREVANFIFSKQPFNKLAKLVFVSCSPAAALQYIPLL